MSDKLISARKHKIRDAWILLLCFGFILVLGYGCSKKEESGELHHKEGAPLKIDYEQLTKDIYHIEEKIRAHTDDTTLRAELVTLCVDSSAGVIRAVGRGLPLESSRSRPLALQSAERAALVDAYRWVAYLLRLKDDISVPQYGVIETSVPSVSVVKKDTLHNDEIRLMVETKL